MVTQQKKKVFGIGFSKTGTTSLENAMKVLGYRSYNAHYADPTLNFLAAVFVHGDYEEIIRFAKYYDFFADGPWGGTILYKELVKKYPDAHYILTVREPETWYDSFQRMVHEKDEDGLTGFDALHKTGQFGASYFFKYLFGIDSLKNNKKMILDHYIRYNEDVEAFFSKGNYSFMKTDLTKGGGWEPLCQMLGVEVPDKPFPHSNKGRVYEEDRRKPTFKEKALYFKAKVKWKLKTFIDKL